MNAKVVQVEGITFVGRAGSNHWIPMDGPSEFKGSDAATRPKELLLLGLGGCTGSDVASILIKMKEKVSKFEIDIEAETASEHPRVFTSLHLEYIFWGENLKGANIEKAINLSKEKYCAVQAMLQKAVKITNSYVINPD